MVKHYIVFTIAALACILSAKATIVQTVRLKNGSVLNGYIESQDRKDNISFRTENATICLSGANVSTTEHVYRLSELSKEWIDWAEKNSQFIGSGDTRTLTLNEVIFVAEMDTIATDTTTSASLNNQKSFENSIRTKENVSKVRIIERGSILKYVEMIPNTYRFNWSEVESITAERRPKTVLSGIDRVYRLKNGTEVKGQYAGESYNMLSIYNESGMVETYNINDVVKYYYKGVNPKQTIFEQSKLLDVVHTKTGTVEGVIVERDFSSNANHLVIQQVNAPSRIIKFKEVDSYSKKENPMWNEIDDVILSEGEFMINRMKMDSVMISLQENTIMLSHVKQRTIIKKEGEITKVYLEFNNPNHSSTDNLLLVKLSKYSGKKNVQYGFSTDIMKMKKIRAVSTDTTINNTTKIGYEIKDLGLYTVYNIDTKEAYLFELTE